MPAPSPTIFPLAAAQLGTLGQQIRTRRQALKVSATATAEAAGLSRVTLHRIETGEASVTMGAYMNVMASLDLQMAVVQEPLKGHAGATAAPPHADREGWIPARIRLSDYPALRRLAWHVHGVAELRPAEALGIYERHARQLDEQAMETHERQLLDALRIAFAEGGTGV